MDINFVIRFGLCLIIALMVGGIVFIINRQDNNFLLERLKKGHSATKRKSIFDDLLEIIKPVTIANMKSNKNQNSTKQMLIRLGLPANENDIMDFENKRMLRLIISFAFGIFLSVVLLPMIHDGMSQLLLGTIFICMPSMFSYMSPIWNLKRRLVKKEKAFDKFFPDAIDLLCVCVEAGLGIDSAIERVGREFTYFSPEVGGEFQRIAKDMLSGVSKQDALKGLSERVQNKDIQSFVAVIIQADKMGASIASSLSISADSLRTKRKQRLEALVGAASTKMTIPLVLCLLPATFAVVLTPAIIQVVESLGKMNGFK